MATIICTVGISALLKLNNEETGNGEKNPLFIPEWQESFKKVETEYLEGGLQTIKAKIEEIYLPTVLERYEKLLRENGPYSEWTDGDEIWRTFPAEVASTIRILQHLDKDMKPNTTSIVLLGTDTVDGYLSTKILEFIFRWTRYEIDLCFPEKSEHFIRITIFYRSETACMTCGCVFTIILFPNKCV